MKKDKRKTGWQTEKQIRKEKKWMKMDIKLKRYEREKENHMKERFEKIIKEANRIKDKMQKKERVEEREREKKEIICKEYIYKDH